MIILALLLITSSCTWSSVFPLYFRPDSVVFQGIDGALYEFSSEFPSSGDWLTFNPYQRYLSSNHRSKRQLEDWGVKGTITIPIGGGSFKPRWNLDAFATQSDPTAKWRVDAGLHGNFRETPSWSFKGKVESTDTKNHLSATGQIGGRFGKTPDWLLEGVLSHREKDLIGRVGGGFNSQGGSTFGLGLERGRLGGHIDITNGRVSLGRGSVPNTDPSKG